MNRFSTLSLAALALTLGSVSLPAQAQLMGRGGLGGSLGGGLGGGLGGMGSMGRSMDGTLGSAGSITDTVRSRGSDVTSTASGTASTAGSQSVDRKTGKVHADRSASGSGHLASSATTPMNSAGGSLGGSGTAAGSTDAQLVGTNNVRGVAQSARSTTTDTAGQARSAASQTGQALTSRASSAVGGTSATAVGAAQGSVAIARTAGESSLALAGSSAAGVAGATGVKPGMVVRSLSGAKLGKVKQVAADGSGKVQSLVVSTGAGNVTLPASQLSAQGDGKGLVATGQ